jgi:hypothetical protein
MLNRMFTYVTSRSVRRARSVAMVTSGALFAGLMVTIGAGPSVAQSVDPTVLCGMCLTEPAAVAVSVTGSSKLTVNGGGVYANSNAAPAVSVTGSSKIVTIAQVRAAGTIVKTGSSTISGSPAAGLTAPLFADPYSDRAPVVSVGPNNATIDFNQSNSVVIPVRADATYRDVTLNGSGSFTFPDTHRYCGVVVGGSVTATLKPGRYRNVTFGGSSKVTLAPGVYWFAGSLSVTSSSKVTGTDATLVLACGTATNDLRACNNETGGKLLVTGSSQLTLNGNTPTTPAIRFVPGNNADLTVDGSSKLVLANSGIDAPNTPITVTGSSSITTAGVIQARRVSVSGSSAITSTVIPAPTATTTTTAAASTSTTTTSTSTSTTTIPRSTTTTTTLLAATTTTTPAVTSSSTTSTTTIPATTSTSTSSSTTTTVAPGTTTTSSVSSSSTSTSTTTTSTVPEIIVSASLIDIPTIAIAPSSETFLGLTAPQTVFSVQGTGTAVGAAVEVTLSEPRPPQSVSISRDIADSVPNGVAASGVFDFDFAGDQAILTSARISLPVDQQLLAGSDATNLWMAFRDEETGFWVPETNAPVFDPVAKSLTVVTNHFSKRVVLKDRPVNGAWTNQFLDSMFGPFPAQCVPAGTVGLKPYGRVAFAFDTSGSMGVTADRTAAAISRRIAAELRQQDRPGVFSIDSSGRSGALMGAGWTQQALSRQIAEAANGFGGLNHSMTGQEVRSLLELTETSLASTSDVLRQVYLFTDFDGVRSLINPAEIPFLAPSPLAPSTLSQTLDNYGIRLTIVAFADGPPLGPEWGNPSANIKIVYPGPSTGTDLALDLRKQAGRLVDDGSDPDGDGLTTCEEGALFFPNPNFPGGSTRNPTGQIATYNSGVVSFDAPSVFFSQTNPSRNSVPLLDGYDTDRDGTSDGAEISRRKISNSPVLSRAFANLVSQGVDSYFVAVTGRPDSTDTDGDTRGDPRFPAKTETCGSGAPSPLLADTDSDGITDDQECANGTDPNLNPILPANQAKAIPWALDYAKAQSDLDKLEDWRGAKIYSTVQQFASPPGMARYGHIRIDGFIPQAKTATTPCYKNLRPVLASAEGGLAYVECTGYKGDGRGYALSYEDHRQLYLPLSRFIFDLDLKNGVWGMMVHPTCSRDATSTTGACFDSLPIYTADLAGYDNLNVLGTQRKQLIDLRVDPVSKKISVQIKIVQNDTGVDSNVFRPANDAKFVFELLPTNRLQMNGTGDGFPAAEGFWVPNSGSSSVVFNTQSFFGLDPSPLALLGGGFFATILTSPGSLYGLCVPPDVPNATTCVPSNIRYTVNFPDA